MNKTSRPRQLIEGKVHGLVDPEGLELVLSGKEVEIAAATAAEADGTYTP